MRLGFHRIYQNGLKRVGVSTLGLLLVTSCGLGAGAPPTGKELASNYSKICATSRERNAPFFEVSGVKVGSDGVTSTIGGTKIHSVHVTISYRSKGPTEYRCLRGDNLGYMPPQHCLFFDVVDPGRGTRVAAGDTISCEIPVQFQKVDEGWLPLGFENTYLIRR